MKNRLASLDGLRGLAALAVVLSHIDNNIVLQATGPIITALFRTISAGPNAVQILFVLTGFLMAYLYPTLDGGLQFIQKRYTRIFPTFILLALFFWGVTFAFFSQNVFLQILLLVILAFLGRSLWQAVKRINTSGVLGKIIFYLFVFLQIIVLMIITFFLPHLVGRFPDGSFIRSLITLFANITLTMPFSLFTPRLNLVFWSLFAEVIFYISYPFLVIPLIHITKKWGWIIGLLFVVITTKILFDIDYALMYQGGFLVTNLARATGFTAGIVIGSIYQQQGTLWKLLEKSFKNIYLNIAILIIFIGMQWGDAYIRNVTSQVASNYYFLFSSWIIALTLIPALIKGSLVEKILSQKIFVFLGVISYTLYLSHSQVIVWVSTFLSPFEQRMPLWLYVVVLVASVTAFSITIAWVLYKLFDSLYFTYHTKLKTEQLVNKSVVKYSYTVRPISLCVALFVYGGIIVAIYSGQYPPSLFIARQKITVQHIPTQQISLLQQAVTIPFVAGENNLSILALPLEYKDKAAITAKAHHHALVEFTLFDQTGKSVFTSQTTAYLVEGQPEFQFGFPPIPNSKNKKYTAKIKLIDGTIHDQVLLDRNSSGVTMYSAHKNILYSFALLLNRIIFTLKTPPALFALLLVPLILVFQFIKIKAKRK